MEDILLVAPYRELAILAEEYRNKTNLPFSTVIGNLDEGLDEIKESIKKGSKIIVTRGGTAKYLKENLSVPVIEIPVTSFDILKAIGNVSSKGYKKIAFLTTSNIIFKTEHFNRIMDITLQFESCEEVKDLPERVKFLVDKKAIDAIIGDVIATNESIKNGVYGELLQSGEESIKYALEEAERVLKMNMRERARVKEMETILNMIDEAVLTIDKDEVVTVYNSKAEKIFGKAKDRVIGRKIKDCLPNSTLTKVLRSSAGEANMIMEVNDKKVVSNRIPITIDQHLHGAVAIFEEIKSIQKLELNIRKKLNEKGFVAKHSFLDIIGSSNGLKGLIYQAQRYAKSEGTVLIYGETGTGKEIFAQSIHNDSKRVKGPFVSINCAAINENLLESELFGYEAGAFTGALRGGKEGLFELAHGGTLFLDEIGETSLSFQAKLLRVLQEKEIRKIGGDKVIPIDVRIICATNRNLKEEVRNKGFREDLYYRLSVLELNLLPLRERREDVVPMAIAFLKEQCVKENRNMYWKNDNIFAPLLAYDWYGNARELKNFIERLVICCYSNELTENFVKEMLGSKLEKDGEQDTITIGFTEDMKVVEREVLKQLLDRYNGDKERLCKALNISTTTLWRKLSYKNEMDIS
ncbi:sigma 54-interacting transcriptional regulator [Clostridium formicaceticum]|uniref:Histidine kinase n=1 Tax=Clostridium formicaceticum TaxID=1497 RepID=A0AAC9RRZ3_9CLOT|nr:sigma 54-interacting transcriptional regulator [Clostridium formicaceticum]AOY75258.1 histidine kinase [Clostridium formicaceticum]ARE89693.1 Propionate catabolism operon regulatory protein [Clostridium formicaceticum]